MTAKQRLLDRIADEGPLPFEAFMAVALYDADHGFFAGGPLRSTKSGDFLTSPEVSPLFGRTVARFVDAEWNRLDRPADFVIVEAGAGSGSLLAPLLEHLSFVPAAVWAVEASPAARAAIAERLPTVEVVDALDALPDELGGVMIANELLDNLPMAIGVRAGDAWTERWVGAEDGALMLVEAPARPHVVEWLNAYSGPVPEGGVVEVQLDAARWLGAALGRLRAGAFLTFDYGDTAEVLEPRRAEGTIRTYRAHHLGPHPLDEPGATDITADVNFTALIAEAERHGAAVTYQRQDEFLSEWGLRDHLRSLRTKELDLAGGEDAMARLAVRSAVTEAETLLHPRGLGDFRVIVARR